MCQLFHTYILISPLNQPCRWDIYSYITSTVAEIQHNEAVYLGIYAAHEW